MSDDDQLPRPIVPPQMVPHEMPFRPVTERKFHRLTEFVESEDIPGMRGDSAQYESWEQQEARKEEQRQRERANDRQLVAQGLYLNAMGTLIQFNAIVVGIGCATMATVGEPLLRGAAAASLIAHAFAGFLLCLGIRPSRPQEPQPAPIQFVTQERARLDTFAHYRRGWWATMMALILSVLGIAFYLVRYVLPGLT